MSYVFDNKTNNQETKKVADNHGKNVFSGNSIKTTQRKIENGSMYTDDNLSEKRLNIVKKSSAISKTLTYFVAAVSAVSVGVVSAVDLAPTEQSAQIVELEVGDTFVCYMVNLENYNEGDQIVVTISNDFTNRSQVATDSKFSGVEEKLKANVTYKIAVKNGSTTLTEQTFTTKKKEKEKSVDLEQEITKPETQRETEQTQIETTKPSDEQTVDLGGDVTDPNSQTITDDEEWVVYEDENGNPIYRPKKSDYSSDDQTNQTTNDESYGDQTNTDYSFEDESNTSATSGTGQ